MTTSSTLSPRQRTLFNQILSDFLAHGFADFTIDKATRDYHCSKSTIYALGRSKEAIVRRILVSFFKEVTRRTELTITPAKTPQACIRDYFDAITTTLEPASPAFMSDLASTAIGREIYETNTRAATEKITELIARGMERGDFRPLNAPLVAAIVGHSLEHIQQGDYESVSDAHLAYKELGSLILGGIVA